MGSTDTGPRWGVRLRLTVLACVVVIVPLLLATGLVAVMLHQVLTSASVARLTEDARVVQATVEESGPQAIDIRHLGPDAHGLAIRVEDPSGTVSFAWPAEDRTTPIGRQDPDPAEQEVHVEGVSPVPLLGGAPSPIAVSMRADHEGTTYVVAVSAPQRTQAQAVESVVRIMLAGLPLALLVTALLAWVMVGRALQPVERMRAAADRISTGALSSRLPVPTQQDELGRLARTLNEMLCRLESGHETQRRFVADASHELRSPLTTLRTAVQLGRADGTAQRWNDLAEVMDRESLRLARLVEDLLTLSKADEHGTVPITRADVDLDDLALAEKARLRTEAVRVGGSIGPARVEGDENQLARALRNLLDNAVRASTSQVDITSGSDDVAAYLVVEDDGPGIEPSARQRIFGRFVRLDDARHRDAGGSGLGLPIVAEIVRAHGGTVSVDDSPALGGARFTIRLPLPDA